MNKRQKKFRVEGEQQLKHDDKHFPSLLGNDAPPLPDRQPSVEEQIDSMVAEVPKNKSEVLPIAPKQMKIGGAIS